MSYTGPFKTDYYNGTNYWRTQLKYKSTSPPKGRTVLPYSITLRRANGYWNLLNVHNVMSVDAIAVDKLYPRAYDKFWGKVHVQANLVLTLLDRKKSLAMIANRAKQLIRFTRYLRKGQVFLAASMLGLDRSDKRVLRAKRALGKSRDISSGWLEFAFGWTPLIQDIGSAVDVLQRDIDIHRVKTRVLFDHVNYSTNSGSSYVLWTQGQYCVGAWIRVTNPNLLLANELGFTNPAYVVWDAVPFSFVVDWFLPVGRFLQSFSNDYGLQTFQEYRQWGLKTRGISRHISHGNIAYPANGYAAVRTVAPLPRPRLISRLRFPKVDPWLAATSVSLLTQQLTSSKRS